jgi:hypothetical protein
MLKFFTRRFESTKPMMFIATSTSSEPKEVLPPNSFKDLTQLFTATFGGERVNPPKFFYLDTEGDVISVTSDMDLQEAYSCFKGD